MRRPPLRWVWWRVGLALFCVAGVLLGASQAFGAQVMNDVLMGAFHVILWSIVLGVLARTWPRRTPPISRIVGGAVGAALANPRDRDAPP